MEKKEADLQDALDDRNAERRTIAARVDVLEDARAELQKARILMILDMKSVLTAEQWERLVRIQRELRRQRRERLGRFYDRRPPPERRPR